MMLKSVRIEIAALVVLAVVSPANAKKVICVDGCNTTFVNNHEGWERSQANIPPDVIQIGGPWYNMRSPTLSPTR